MAVATDHTHSGAMRIAIEGCGHGTLDAIYASIEKSCEVKGWNGVDLVIIGGDFQAVRDRRDLNVTAMPAKYRDMADFHQYYWGQKKAPYLTIFVGGNHEASNHLFELFYGGWVAPNIYYLGAANVIQAGSLKIAGMSGIWKGYDFRKPHYERLPYSHDDMYSIYHVRELDVRKLLAYRSQVDIGMSHDWPKGIEWLGNHNQLFKHKAHLKEDAQSGKLGNTAAQQVMDRLRPLYWFSAHLHTKYTALKSYDDVVLEWANLMGSEAETNQQQNVSPRTTPVQHQIAAWHDFGRDVRQHEAKETAQLLEEEKTRREEAERSGVPLTANYNFDETYKEVKLGDGFKRNIASINRGADRDGEQKAFPGISQLDGCCASIPLKRRRDTSSSPGRPNHQGVRYAPLDDAQTDDTVLSLLDTSTTTNPDAIDVDMSDEETTLLVSAKGVSTEEESSLPETKTEQAGAFAAKPGGDGIIELEDAGTVVKSSFGNTSMNRQLAEGQATAESVTTNVAASEISEEMRAQLAALSSKFEEPVRVSPPLPHPEDITNKITRFLALSKCEDRQNFLQLLEIEPHDTTITSTERPINLQYVPEWLAISRVFASELKLGGSSKDRTPQHRGDTYYRDRIIEEEKWIHQNVTEPGRLDIPLEFQTCVASYDSDLVAGSQDMPREVSNPQTSAFCSLIGIENPFNISEEERDARMATRPSESTHSPHRGRGGHGGRGVRGGRSSRGARGHGDRGWGSRGRGRY